MEQKSEPMKVAVSGVIYNALTEDKKFAKNFKAISLGQITVKGK